MTKELTDLKIAAEATEANTEEQQRTGMGIKDFMVPTVFKPFAMSLVLMFLFQVSFELHYAKRISKILVNIRNFSKILNAQRDNNKPSCR